MPATDLEAQQLGFQLATAPPGHAFQNPLIPPVGRELGVPHVVTFAGIVGSANQMYSYRSDEALRDSIVNATAMRRDPFLMSLLEERKEAVALLPWHIAPEDDHNPEQKAVATAVETAIRAIPRLEDLIWSLLEAIWYGKYAVEVAWDYTQIHGKKYLNVCRHVPINGDKIFYRYARTAEGQRDEDNVPAILIHSAGIFDRERAETVYTDRGRALLLRDPFWRNRFLFHQHLSEDADYRDGEQAGAIHGVGVRSKLYWCNWIKQEVITWVLNFIERTGLGLTIYFYDDSDPAAKASAEESAKKQSANGTIIMWPRGREAKTGSGIERIETQTQGADILLKIITEYFNRDMERYVVGQSMSSGTEKTGLGSEGITDFSQNTKFNRTRMDSNRLASSLTGSASEPSLVYMLQKANHPSANFNLRWAFDVDRPNPEKQLEAMNKVYGMEIAFKADEARAAAGLSKPKPGDEVVQKKPEQPPGGEPLGGLLGKPGAGAPGQPGAQPGQPGQPGAQPTNGQPQNGHAQANGQPASAAQEAEWHATPLQIARWAARGIMPEDEATQILQQQHGLSPEEAKYYLSDAKGRHKGSGAAGEDDESGPDHLDRLVDHHERTVYRRFGSQSRFAAGDQPREAISHGGKLPGEFAPKGSSGKSGTSTSKAAKSTNGAVHGKTADAFTAHPELHKALMAVHDAREHEPDQRTHEAMLARLASNMTPEHHAALKAAGIDDLDQAVAHAGHHVVASKRDKQLAKIAAQVDRIPDGDSRYVGGHLVKHSPKGTYRVETDRHYVDGSAEDVARHVQRQWDDQRPDQKRIDAALARAGSWEEPNVFTDRNRFDAEDAAARQLPKGTRVVSLNEHTHGRLGTIAPKEETRWDGRVVRTNGVKLDNSPEWASLEVEPLDPAQSWRSHDKPVAAPTAVAKQREMFARRERIRAAIIRARGVEP